jgi:hypothetical protein
MILRQFPNNPDYFGTIHPAAHPTCKDEEPTANLQDGFAPASVRRENFRSWRMADADPAVSFAHY